MFAVECLRWIEGLKYTDIRDMYSICRDRLKTSPDHGQGFKPTNFPSLIYLIQPLTMREGNSLCNWEKIAYRKCPEHAPTINRSKTFYLYEPAICDVLLCTWLASRPNRALKRGFSKMHPWCDVQAETAPEPWPEIWTWRIWTCFLFAVFGNNRRQFVSPEAGKLKNGGTIQRITCHTSAFPPE